jgi:hypothetical protein
MAQNNIIHRIRFTVKKYQRPSVIARNYLVTEETPSRFVITENNKKIRL